MEGMRGWGRMWLGGTHGLRGGHALEPRTTAVRLASGRYASYWNTDLLVSTHVVCERLSVMQEQVRLPEFLVHFANNTNSWLAKTTPTLKIWPDVGTLSFE